MQHRAKIVPGLFISIGLALGGGEGMAETPTAPVTAHQEQEVSYAVIYRAGPKWKPGAPLEEQGLRGHFYYLSGLAKAGTVALAGPLGADGGLVLLRVRDQAAADQVIAADPAVIAGVFQGEARPFLPRLADEGPIRPVRP